VAFMFLFFLDYVCRSDSVGLDSFMFGPVRKRSASCTRVGLDELSSIFSPFFQVGEEVALPSFFPVSAVVEVNSYIRVKDAG